MFKVVFIWKPYQSHGCMARMARSHCRPIVRSLVGSKVTGRRWKKRLEMGQQPKPESPGRGNNTLCPGLLACRHTRLPTLPIRDRHPYSLPVGMDAFASA